MKFIKLFEAFESNILPKTLNFLSEDSKKTFLKKVKSYCDNIDFPYSKISDDFFQYLPFKKAVKEVISSKEETKKCDATSTELFNDKGIEGVTCKGGKINRKWGSGTRKVDCTKCKGTGMMTVSSGEGIPQNYELIKFWITKDGDLKEITITDGRPTKLKGAQFGNLDKEGYVSIKNLSSVNFKIPNGTPIVFKEGRVTTTGVIVFDEYENAYFAIHNNRAKDGSSPSRELRNQYSHIGRYYWQLTAGSGTRYDLFDELKVKLNDAKKDDEIDYLLYNKDIKTGNALSEKSEADFAIVFDTGKLKNSEFYKRSDIKSDRSKARMGAQRLKDPEEIKKSNLENRLMKIAQKEFNIESFNSLFSRLLFDKYILFFELKDTIQKIQKLVNIWDNKDKKDVKNDKNDIKKNNDSYYSILNMLFRESDHRTKERMSKIFQRNREKYSYGYNSYDRDTDMEYVCKMTLFELGYDIQDLKNDSKETEKIDPSVKEIHNILKYSNSLKTDALGRIAKLQPNNKKLATKLIEVGEIVLSKVKKDINDETDMEIALNRLNSINELINKPRYSFNDRKDRIIYYAKGLSSDDIDNDTLEAYIKTLNEIEEVIKRIP